jgi:hypothetical protein
MTSTETKTPAKTTARKAAAKKAPAKKAAPTRTAMRWLIEKVYENGKDQTARVGDRVYAIKKAGDGWKATVTVDGGKAETLAEGGFGKAYGACTAHNKSAA